MSEAQEHRMEVRWGLILMLSVLAGSFCHWVIFDASNRKVRRNRSGGRPAGSERMAMRSAAAAAEKQGGRYGELGLASQELHRNLFII